MNKMSFYQASEVTAETANCLAHSFDSAIVQKKSPGIYVYEFGRGKMEVESVVSYMLARCDSTSAITAQIDTLSSILRNPVITRSIFQAIFPKMSQSLSDGFTVTTSPDIQRIIQKALGSKGSPGLVAVMHELHLEIFSEQRFVLNSKGTSYREYRHERIPSYLDLARDFVRNELITIINESALKIRLTGFKYTPASLMAEYERILSDLGRRIAQIGYSLGYFNDALYCVRTYFALGTDLVSALSEEVLKSTEFNDLLVNMTIVDAALDPTNVIKSPTLMHRTLLTSVRETVKMLSLSTRYQVVTLKTAIAAYRYSSVVDERSNLVGGVLSYSVKFHHPVYVGMFDKIPELSDFVQTTILNRDTNDMASLVAPLEGKDPMAIAHTAVAHLMSAKTVDESFVDLRSTLAVIDVLSESDLKHIAAAYADTVYITKVDYNDGAALEPSVIFAKALQGKRLYADDQTFEGTVYTSDPATLILSLNDFEATIPMDMVAQDVPEHMWDMFIVEGALPLQRTYDEPKSISAEIGGSPVTVSLTLVELMRHNARHSAGIIYNPLSEKVFSAAVMSVLHTYAHVISSIEFKEEREKMKVGLGAQVCHMLSAMIVDAMRGSVYTGLVEDIVRRFVKKTSPRQRDLTFKLLNRVNYRRQIELALSFLILTRMAILEPSVGEMADSVEISITKFLAEHKFYDALIGTDFERITSLM